MNDDQGREWVDNIRPLVDARTISRLTNLPLQTIWRACRDGSLPHYRLARTIRFDPVEVLRHIRKDVSGGVALSAPDIDNSEEIDPGFRIDDVEWWSES